MPDRDVVKEFIAVLFRWIERQTLLNVAIMVSKDGEDVALFAILKGTIKMKRESPTNFAVDAGEGQMLEFDLNSFRVIWQLDDEQDGVTLPQPFRLQRGDLDLHFYEDAPVAHA